MIDYFISTEEYEKCAVLTKFKKQSYETKLRIYIDMDGVLSNFEKAASEIPSNGIKGNRPDLNIRLFKVRNKCLEARKKQVKELLEMGHDLFIAINTTLEVIRDSYGKLPKKKLG